MKILVACDFPEVALEQLRSLASELEYSPGITGQKLTAAAVDAGVLVVKNTRISRETISRAEALQMIVHAGPGPGKVDLEVASEAAVFVSDCPTQHATAVAELTMALVLALDRRLIEHALAAREGSWKRAELGDARGLADRTIGILGYDEVGRRVAHRARAFGMHVVAWSADFTSETPSEPDIEICNWPRELARRSDVVTVHAPRDEAADQGVLVDAEFLENLPEGAYLVHVGHPGAIDRHALADAINRRGLRVASDVHDVEPTSDKTGIRLRLCELPGVVCTQHIGDLTQQSRRATAAETVRIIRAYLVSGAVENCLNLAEHSPATWQLVLRIRDQVGVMAAVLEAVRADGINAEEISSRVFRGAKAAWSTIALDERPSMEALNAIRVLPDVLHVDLRAVV